jgi:uncharacterized protein YecE (DUF72 family)
MKILVGTSGWYYEWNEKKNFEWYVNHSNLNSVELNASFYRFPFLNHIRGWSKKCGDIRFSVKVHRKITHILRLKSEGKQTWRDFKKLFSPIEDKIDFYLFQMPPSFSTKFLTERVKRFFEGEEDKEKVAIEFRSPDWFEEKYVKEIEKIGTVFVSVDSPQIKSFIVKTNGVIYLRLHGRTDWYSHNYEKKELEEISEKIAGLKPEKIYVYFNNNHNMLLNARNFYEIIANKL